MQTLHGAINGHDTAEVGESEEQHETKKKITYTVRNQTLE